MLPFLLFTDSLKNFFVESNVVEVDSPPAEGTFWFFMYESKANSADAVILITNKQRLKVFLIKAIVANITVTL